MMGRRTRISRTAARALALAGMSLLAGCVNPFDPRVATVRGVSSPPPVPNSASKVVELFAWCWSNRAYQEYTEIFSDDFRFQFSQRDTAGQSERGEFLNREQELEIAKHLFVEGNATNPPATSIVLTIDRNLIDSPDSRQGKNPKWHREIATQVTLTIRTDEQDFQVLGSARFFLVRGDSVLIPPELMTRFSQDSTRWWIERWEDETQGGESATRSRGDALAATGRGSAPLPRGTAGRLGAGNTVLNISLTRLKLAYLSP